MAGVRVAVRAYDTGGGPPPQGLEGEFIINYRPGVAVANKEHVKRLKQGATKWNAWREKAASPEPDLSGADLSGAGLTGANLTGAQLLFTVFGDVDLTRVTGLETCNHQGPSILDHQTLQKSGPLPLPFLRGMGLPDKLIDYFPALLDQAIQ